MTLRQIASLTDNLLTYWKGYPPVHWGRLDSIITRIDSAFVGPMGAQTWVSKTPLVVTGVRPVDSVAFLTPAVAPLLNPLTVPPEAVDQTPDAFALYQNFPNPFNPATTIRFRLVDEARVSLVIYDVLGREVTRLLDNEEMPGGDHEVTFNAASLATGVYFYRIIVNDGQFHQIKKMMLLK